MIVVECDLCGERVEQKEVGVVVVQMPETRVQNISDEYAKLIAQTFASNKAARDEFHVCPSCGLQMLIAFGQAKLERHRAAGFEWAQVTPS